MTNQTPESNPEEPLPQPMQRGKHKFGHKEMVMTPQGVGTILQFGEPLTYYVTIPRDQDVMVEQYGQWFEESELVELTDAQYELHSRARARHHTERPY